MKHKVLKSKGVSLYGQWCDTEYRTVIDTRNLETGELGDAIYFADFRYSRKTGHVTTLVFRPSEDLADINPDFAGCWHFDMPLDWAPTESQLERLAEEAIKKLLMGHLKKEGFAS